MIVAMIRTSTGWPTSANTSHRQQRRVAPPRAETGTCRCPAAGRRPARHFAQLPAAREPPDHVHEVAAGPLPAHVAHDDQVRRHQHRRRRRSPPPAAQLPAPARHRPTPIGHGDAHVEHVVHEGVEPGAELRLLKAHPRQLAVAAVEDRLQLLEQEAGDHRSVAAGGDQRAADEPQRRGEQRDLVGRDRRCATRTWRVKRTEIGLLRRRATKPRSGRKSAANTASSAPRRLASSVTRMPASPRATRTTSAPTRLAPMPPPPTRPPRRSPRSGPRRCRAAVRQRDRAVARDDDARLRRLRQLLDAAFDDGQAGDLHRGAGLLRAGRRDDDVRQRRLGRCRQTW